MANITFRSDPETDRALAELTADGSERSDAIRRALAAQAKRHRQERMRAEAERMAADPAYLAEVAETQAVMEPYRAW